MRAILTLAMDLSEGLIGAVMCVLLQMAEREATQQRSRRLCGAELLRCLAPSLGARAVLEAEEYRRASSRRRHRERQRRRPLAPSAATPRFAPRQQLDRSQREEQLFESFVPTVVEGAPSAIAVRLIRAGEQSSAGGEHLGAPAHTGSSSSGL